MFIPLTGCKPDIMSMWTGMRAIGNEIFLEYDAVTDLPKPHPNPIVNPLLREVHGTLMLWHQALTEEQKKECRADHPLIVGFDDVVRKDFGPLVTKVDLLRGPDGVADAVVEDFIIVHFIKN